MNQDAESLTWNNVVPLGWSSPTRYGVVHLIVTKPGDPYARVRAGCSDARPTGGQLNLKITGNVCRTCAKHPSLKTAFAALERPRCPQRCRPDPKNRTYAVQCTKPMHHDGKHVNLATIEGSLREFRWVSGEKNHE